MKSEHEGEEQRCKNLNLIQVGNVAKKLTQLFLPKPLSVKTIDNAMFIKMALLKERGFTPCWTRCATLSNDALAQHCRGNVRKAYKTVVLRSRL